MLVQQIEINHMSINQSHNWFWHQCLHNHCPDVHFVRSPGVGLRVTPLIWGVKVLHMKEQYMRIKHLCQLPWKETQVIASQHSHRKPSHVTTMNTLHCQQNMTRRRINHNVCINIPKGTLSCWSTVPALTLGRVGRLPRAEGLRGPLSSKKGASGCSGLLQNSRYLHMQLASYS